MPLFELSLISKRDILFQQPIAHSALWDWEENTQYSGRDPAPIPRKQHKPIMIDYAADEGDYIKGYIKDVDNTGTEFPYQVKIWLLIEEEPADIETDE